MRFISSSVIWEEGSTWKQQCKVEVSVLRACRSEFGWLTERLKFSRSRWVEPLSMFAFHSGQSKTPNEGGWVIVLNWISLCI